MMGGDLVSIVVARCSSYVSYSTENSCTVMLELILKRGVADDEAKSFISDLILLTGRGVREDFGMSQGYVYLFVAIDFVEASVLTRLCIDVDQVDVVVAREVDELRWYIGVLEELELGVIGIKEQMAFRCIVEGLIGNGITP